MANRKTGTAKDATKATGQEPNQEAVGRSAFITIGSREVELVLTTRATRLISARYGGLENRGETLETSENFEETLGEVIWLITLLANQSIQIHNLQSPVDPKRNSRKKSLNSAPSQQTWGPTGKPSPRPSTGAPGVR